MMSYTKKKHTIAILALPDFVPFDLSIPYNIFSFVRTENGEQPYDVIFCADHPSIISGNFKIEACQPLETLSQIDSIFVPGLLHPLAFKNPAVLTALQTAAKCGIRIASICTGACVLATAGLLNGLRATSHWEIADAFIKAYPNIKFEADVLFVDNGQILTSAGLASGIDLCLHIIRKDFGSIIAEQTAAFFVSPIERYANHPQQIKYTAPENNDNLTPIIVWLTENLHTKFTLNSIATYAGMSPRTLNRKFQAQMGMAPMTWITNARIQRAKTLLESTTLPIEQIATAIGFDDAAPFRKQFRQKMGVNPITWRKTWHYIKDTTTGD